MIYGYVRVSTLEQHEERQVLKMEALGVDATFVDKASGKDMDRPRWRELMSTVREGDVILLDSLDRLGRDYDDVTREWRRLTREVGCDVACLDLEFMDSRKFRSLGLMGRFMEDSMLGMLAYVAQVEREKMLQRQREGIAVARAAGKYTGRKPIDVDAARLAELAAEEAAGRMTATAAAEALGVSRRTYCRRRDMIREEVA